MKTKTFLITLSISFLSMLTASCHDDPDYDNDIYGNFDALWEIVDSRYCFFAEKDLDWAEIGKAYRAQITPKTNSFQLFFICAAMLDELKDGHVNLVSRYNTSYYRNWWSDYPQDFNLRTLQEYYLKFDYLQTSGISYKELPDKVGYMYYPSFSYTVSETSLDYILAILSGCRGLIIDIRDNGGGALTNIETLVSRFIDNKITGGYIIHKTGPGHDAFSDPYPIEYSPANPGRIKWSRPIILLTNRSCFSAANSFTAVMKSLPNVLVIGAKTGGGGGLPFSSELPVGWAVRFSSCPLLSPEGDCIEEGIEPSEGYEVHSPDIELASGKDAILDKAIEIMLTYPDPDPDEDEDEKS